MINAELEPMPTEEALEFANFIEIDNILYKVISYSIEGKTIYCEITEKCETFNFDLNYIKSKKHFVYTMANVPIDNENYND